MEHFKLMTIKFIATFVLCYLVLNLGYGLSIGQILLISLLSFITYFIGDLFILERTNNFIATLADFVLNFSAIFVLLHLMDFLGDRLMASFITASALTIYELFFHLYVSEKLGLMHRKIPIHRYDYMTEFTRDFDPFLDDEDDDEDYY